MSPRRASSWAAPKTPFYSEGILRETAKKIPDGTLRVYEGVGHGVPKGRKRRYEEDALAFLSSGVVATASY